MTSSCDATIQRIRDFEHEVPPEDWDEVSPASIHLAEFFVCALAKEICTDEYPWKEPGVYQEPYGGGLTLSWHHSYRRMSISLDSEQIFAFVGDQWGIIREIDYLGIEALRELWTWFWNPEATWTYSWQPRKYRKE